jgi:tetratricopeptide (TPR) repeat protein
MSSQPQAPGDGLRLGEALDAIKNDDVNTARAIFGVSQEQVNDYGLRRALSSFERGMTLFSQGQNEDAKEYFDQANALVTASNSETAEHMAAAIKMNDGAVRLHNGDAHGAVALFEEVTNFIEERQFESPELQRMALRMKAASYRAMIRASLNAGDVEGSLQAWERASRLQFELLSDKKPDNPEDLPSFITAYAFRVEMSCMQAHLAMQAFDFNRAHNILRQAAEDVRTLRNYSKAAAKTDSQPLAVGTLAMFEILTTLNSVAREGFTGQKTRASSELKILTGDDLNQAFLRLEQSGRELGGEGRDFVQLSKQLQEMRRNLMPAALSKIKKDRTTFGRYSGAIAIITFLVIAAVLSRLFKLSAPVVPFVLALAAVLGLIVGFNLRAVKFDKLLRVATDLVPKESKEQEKAPKDEAKDGEKKPSEG